MPLSVSASYGRVAVLVGCVAASVSCTAAQDDASRVSTALEQDAYPDAARVWIRSVLDYASDVAGPLGRAVPTWPTPSAVRDSVASALRSDPDSEMLTAALAYLDSPSWVRLNDQVRLNLPVPEEAVQEAQLTMWDPPGKKGTQGRAIRAARYHEALGAAARSSGLLDQAARTFVVSVPDLRADMIEHGRSVEETADRLFGTLGAESEGLQDALSRSALAGAAASDIEEAIVFFESPAGLYVTRARDAGTSAALRAAVVRWVQSVTGGDTSSLIDG